jgi:hypothetical protein
MGWGGCGFRKRQTFQGRDDCVIANSNRRKAAKWASRFVQTMFTPLLKL